MTLKTFEIHIFYIFVSFFLSWKMNKTIWYILSMFSMKKSQILKLDLVHLIVECMKLE